MVNLSKQAINLLIRDKPICTFSFRHRPCTSTLPDVRSRIIYRTVINSWVSHLDCYERCGGRAASGGFNTIYCRRIAVLMLFAQRLHTFDGAARIRTTEVVKQVLFNNCYLSSVLCYRAGQRCRNAISAMPKHRWEISRLVGRLIVDLVDNLLGQSSEYHLLIHTFR